MAIKAVFFDLDDTLYGGFDEGDAHGYASMGAWVQAHLGVSGEEFVRQCRQNRARLGRQQPGMPPIHDRVISVQGALERMGLNAMRYANTLHRIYWDAMMDKMALRPGVTQLLDDLRAAGVKTAVCTDMLADIQMEKIERLGLTDKLDYMVSSEEAGVDKPASPIFWLALQKCGCIAAQAVMVGDNFRHDVQGAADLGITGIWLNWSNKPRPETDSVYTEVHTFEQAAAQIRALL